MSDVIYITALEQYEAVLWLCLACSDIQPESTVFPLYYCSAYVHVAVHLVCQSSVMLSHSPVCTSEDQTHISMVNILYIKWNSFSPTWESPLTCDDDQRCETGEGRNIKLHAVQTSRELQDGVDPIPKTSDALVFVKHWPVAEDELVCFRTGPLVLKKKGKSSDCSTGQNILVL